jgi:hypothetical protein
VLVAIAIAGAVAIGGYFGYKVVGGKRDANDTLTRIETTRPATPTPPTQPSQPPAGHHDRRNAEIGAGDTGSAGNARPCACRIAATGARRTAKGGTQSTEGNRIGTISRTTARGAAGRSVSAGSARAAGAGTHGATGHRGRSTCA